MSYTASGSSVAPPPRPILVLGLGNVLLRDEGLGVHVLRVLADLPWPAEVELSDGGTAGLNLVDRLAGRRVVIVVDALDSLDPPGTIRRLRPPELASVSPAALSLHEAGLLEALAAARCVGCAPQEVIVLGVQPGVVDWGLELSPAIAAVVPKLIEMVKAEVAAALASQAAAA